MRIVVDKAIQARNYKEKIAIETRNPRRMYQDRSSGFMSDRSTCELFDKVDQMAIIGRLNTLCRGFLRYLGFAKRWSNYNDEYISTPAIMIGIQACSKFAWERAREEVKREFEVIFGEDFVEY